MSPDTGPGLPEEMRPLEPGDEGYQEYVLPFQTNKVRKYLANIFNYGGYPVRENYHVDYYSGIAMWVPDQWEIVDKYVRTIWWKDYPEQRWKTVVIWKIDQLDSLTDELIFKLTGDIPIYGGLMSGIWQNEMISDTIKSIRSWSIFRNILFYNTLKDEVIWANWDLISPILQRYIQNGERTRFYEVIRNDRINLDHIPIYYDIDYEEQIYHEVK